MEIYTFRPKEGWSAATDGAVIFEENPEKIEKLQKKLESPIIVSIKNDTNAIVVKSLRLTGRGYESSLLSYTRDSILEGYLRQALFGSNSPIEAIEF